MLFIETPVFTLQIKALVDDDRYGDLQRLLAAHPDIGDLIEDTGGLRKVRMALPGRGKRGGARVIYHHAAQACQIRMLMAYAKNEQEDLTADQRKALRRIVETWK